MVGTVTYKEAEGIGFSAPGYPQMAHVGTVNPDHARGLCQFCAWGSWSSDGSNWLVQAQKADRT